MSVLARRAVAGRALNEVMLREDFRRWVDEWASSACDDDGDVVALVFSDDEPGGVLIDELAPYLHPVIVSTLHRGSVAAWALASIATNEAADVADAGDREPAVIAVGETMTVGDVVDELMALAQRAYGSRFVLEFAGSRRAVAALAPA